MASELMSEILRSNPVPDTMRMVEERASDFKTPLEMKLTAIALSRLGRSYMDQQMDDYWASDNRRTRLLDRAAETPREVIIGGGYHAAVYSAIRMLQGFPRPLVIEASKRVGGTFAMTSTPAFYLNSRNRQGSFGLAGDRRAALNYLPGAPVQASNLSMAEYQTNTDMAFVIRATLAEYADVLTDTAVMSVEDTVSYGGDQLPRVINTTRGTVLASRIIDARGIGSPRMKTVASSGMYAFPDFMSRMTDTWPLRGVRRAAVIGDGDSAKCAVESLLGLAPQGAMSVTALDNVERVDWYGPNLPTTCENWRAEIRGRYQGIGPSLRPDRFGERRVNVIGDRATPIALPGQPLIGGRSYDLVVMAAGNGETEIPGLEEYRLRQYRVNGYTIARRDTEENSIVYRVGPHARLGFSDDEFSSGIADIPANSVSMFRTGPKTAALAATLPAASA